MSGASDDKPDPACAQPAKEPLSDFADKFGRIAEGIDWREKPVKPIKNWQLGDLPKLAIPDYMENVLAKVYCFECSYILLGIVLYCMILHNIILMAKTIG